MLLSLPTIMMNNFEQQLVFDTIHHRYINISQCGKKPIGDSVLKAGLALSFSNLLSSFLVVASLVLLKLKFKQMDLNIFTRDKNSTKKNSRNGVKTKEKNKDKNESTSLGANNFLTIPDRNQSIAVSGTLSTATTTSMNREYKESVKITKRVIRLLVVFLICWVPNLVTNMIYLVSMMTCLDMTNVQTQVLTIFHKITQTLFISYCVINPVLVANKGGF